MCDLREKLNYIALDADAEVHEIHAADNTTVNSAIDEASLWHIEEAPVNVPTSTEHPALENALGPTDGQEEAESVEETDFGAAFLTTAARRLAALSWKANCRGSGLPGTLDCVNVVRDRRRAKGQRRQGVKAALLGDSAVGARVRAPAAAVRALAPSTDGKRAAIRGTWACSRVAVPLLLVLTGSAALLSGAAGGPWQAPGPLQPPPLQPANLMAQAMPMQQEEPSYLQQWAWEELSAAFDSDGDGLVSRSEFRRAVRALWDLPPPAADLVRLFGDMDFDGSGKLTLFELAAGVAPMAEGGDVWFDLQGMPGNAH